MCSQPLNFTSCTGQHISEMYCVMQISILTIFLIYILFLNILVIVAIFTTAELRGCWFSMQMATSYIGNILAALSLVGNGLYYGDHGNPPFKCQYGIDRFFFLYFGTSMNSIILLFNTHYRYNKIVSMKQNNTLSRGSNAKNMFLKSLLPAWASALLISSVASYFQRFMMSHRFLINVCICGVPVTISIVWNILLSRYLRKSRKNPVIEQHKDSMVVIERATYIINFTIVVHIFFVVLGSLAACYVSFDLGDHVSATRMIWLLRLAYFAFYTADAKVYLYKTALARRVISRKVNCVTRRFQRTNNTGEKSSYCCDKQSSSNTLDTTA